MFFEYDDEVRGLYEEGHWEWSDEFNELTFIRDKKFEEEPYFMNNIMVSGPIKFNNDMEDKEEKRFKKIIQRTTIESDVITLQDVKDVALFTAPKSILKPSVIKVFHLPVTDRFLRSLILYFHFFLQVKDEMVQRIREKQSKIETPNTIEIEKKYSVDLEDLRLLIAKEYCSMIQEQETHRLFKSNFYNIARHNPQINLNVSDVHSSFAHRIKQSDYNTCHILNQTQTNNRMKLLVHSPLFDEIFRKRNMEFQLIGLGLAEYSYLNSRLQYLEHAIIAPEKELQCLGLTLGIIGLPRKQFDTMLRHIKFIKDESKVSILARHRPSNMLTKLYPRLYIPESSDIKNIQTTSFKRINTKFDMSTSLQQQRKWMKYLIPKRWSK